MKFGKWVTRLGLDTWRALLPLAAALRHGVPLLLRWMRGARPGGSEAGRHLRRALEGLGMTYVKLGQYLALRMDVLPVEVCQELSHLFEDVKPLGMDDVYATIEAELGGPWHTFFQSLDPEPLGSASIAQVHRAMTRDGQVLAVKVQRPGLEAVFEADMRNLRRLARALDALGLLGAGNPGKQMVEEFADFTRKELDFRSEGRNADAVRGQLDRKILIPAIRWDLTTRRILCLQLIEGITLQHLCDLTEAGRADEIPRLLPGVDLERVMGDVLDACLGQLFVEGRFHGDPHPGNILVQANGVPAFVDFGIYGELDPSERDDLADYLSTVVSGRFARGARLNDRLAFPTERTDMSLYHRELADVLRRWAYHSTLPGASVEERHLGRAIGEVFVVFRRNEVRMGPNQLMVWRAIGLMDATILRLPVKLVTLERMRDFLRSARPGPEQQVRRAMEDPAWWEETRRATEAAGAWAGQLGTSRARDRELPLIASRAMDGARRIALAFFGLTAGLIALALAGPARIAAAVGSLALLAASALIRDAPARPPGARRSRSPGRHRPSSSRGR